MNIVFKQLFSACALIVFLTPAARAVDFPVPDFFKLSVVAEDMSYSGVALSVSQFNSSKSVADIRHFYESSWPQTRVVEHDRMFVLSHLDEERGLLFSVQIEGDWRRQGRPEGYLAVSDLPAYLSGNKSDLPKKGENFPVHVTGEVVNDMVFHDGRKKSRFLYITHKANARTIHDHYQSSLEKRGWSTLNSEFDPRNHRGVLRMQKGVKRMDITLNFSNSETQMTAVELN